MKAVWVPSRLLCGVCGCVLRDHPAAYGQNRGEFSCGNRACAEHGVRYQAPVQRVELVKVEEGADRRCSFFCPNEKSRTVPTENLTGGYAHGDE
jgi:hypothetical protein